MLMAHLLAAQLCNSLNFKQLFLPLKLLADTFHLLLVAYKMKWAELLVPFFNVVYVVIAIVMTALILMQRGAGAQAGSSFGAGASGTVFGAQGSANFLSRSTAVCASLFFIISIGMGIYISHGGKAQLAKTSLMGEYVDPAAKTPPASELPTAPGAPVPAAPAPGAPASGVPAAIPAQDAAATPAPSASPESPMPVATSAEVPAANVPAEAPPAPSGNQN
jgi:preprotein translocase subunit SecG